MSEETGIGWTDATFNPWIGCTRISEGCRNCYAAVETFARVERGKGRELWGASVERHITSDENWKKPQAWDRKASASGNRTRVFCASLADVFESRGDLVQPRLRLFNLIRTTPNLDWQLLTKRPESILPILNEAINLCSECTTEPGHANCALTHDWLLQWVGGEPPLNLWLGTTAENQEMADKRLPQLLNIPAYLHFVSCEPLLGPIDLTPWLYLEFRSSEEKTKAGLTYSVARNLARLKWAIIGGESDGQSGANARECSLDWIHSLTEQCSAADVPFFIKQLGAKPYYLDAITGEKTPFPIKSKKGDDQGDFPCHFLQEMPEVWEREMERKQAASQAASVAGIL